MTTIAVKRSRHFEFTIGLLLVALGTVGMYLTYDDAFWERFAIMRGGKSIATLSKLGGTLRIKSPNTMTWHWIVQDKTDLVDNDLIHTEATGSGEIQFGKDISFELWPNSLIQVRAAEMGQLTIPKLLSGKIKVKVSPKAKETVLRTDQGPIVIRPKVKPQKPVELTLTVRDQSYSVTDSSEPIEVSLPRATGTKRIEVTPKVATPTAATTIVPEKPKLILPAPKATVLAQTSKNETHAPIRFEWTNTSESKKVTLEIRDTEKTGSDTDTINVTSKEELERKLAVGKYQWRISSGTEATEWRDLSVAPDGEKKTVSSLEDKYSEPKPEPKVEPKVVAKPAPKPAIVKTVPKSVIKPAAPVKPVAALPKPVQVPARTPATAPQPTAPKVMTPAREVETIFYP